MSIDCNVCLWSVHRSTSILYIFYCLIMIIQAKPSHSLLRGVTFRNWPYADRINDRYEGFVVDLMNLIAQKVGFEYRLYFSPDGKYGTEFNGNNINGMIGEVFRNRADFAIADLTVTEARKRYVDFTEAFLENQLAAIIRRDDAVGLRTLEDLVTLNEINHRPDLPPTERHGLLTYGTYKTGATYFHLSKHKDPIAKKIFEWMFRNPDALVRSAKEGFERVNAGRYAFIVESTFAEYLTGIYCNLTMLYDTRSLYPRKFAIALPKGSPYIHAFNKAIRELKTSGTIQRLRHKYWINRCQHHQNQNNNDNPHLMLPSSTPEPSPPPSPLMSSNNITETKNNDNHQLITNNSNNNNDDHSIENTSLNNNNNKNQGTNTMKIEWTSHNRHHHQLQPHQIDRNNNRNSPSLYPYHHRINSNHHQTNRNRKNQDYESDDLQFFSKRTNGSIRPSLISTTITAWIFSLLLFFHPY